MKRVWIFGSERNFSNKEVVGITALLSNFTKNWNAHGNALSSEIEILEERFIKVSVDESVEAASGCSIDSLTEVIKAIEKEYSLVLMNRMNVFFKTNENIEFLKLSEFKNRVKLGGIPNEAIIYNTGVSNEEAFMSSWNLPLKSSWAASLLN